MKIKKENVYSFIFMLIGTLVFVMLFLPAMVFSDSEEAFSGFEIVFGTEFANLGGIATGQIVWNILGVLAYLLPLVACLVALFVKKGMLFAVLLFAISFILFFTMPDYTKTTITIFNTTTEIDVDWTISYGLIIAAVGSALGVFTGLIITSESLQNA